MDPNFHALHLQNLDQSDLFRRRAQSRNNLDVETHDDFDTDRDYDNFCFDAPKSFEDDDIKKYLRKKYDLEKPAHNNMKRQSTFGLVEYI